MEKLVTLSAVLASDVMKYVAFCLAVVFSAFACAQRSAPVFSGNHTSSTEAYAPVQIPQLPEHLDLAGEPVPLENYDTRESLMREMLSTMYLHSRTMLTLLATQRYFPIIEPILKKNGVPEDFKYLCMAESGLDPNAGSSAGAAGLWQLMPAYARSAGLYIGGGVDERYHIEKSTEAACRYLLEAKEKFGSWTLAAASYNVGMAGTAKRLEKQGVDSYYDLYLPTETMRYVFRILAFKLITPNPAAYGYQIQAEDYYRPLPDYTEVTVSGAQIDWSAEARKHGTNYKMLRELNHWIRDYDYRNKTARSFVLKVPKSGTRQ